jgi:hypothetical protein
VQFSPVILCNFRPVLTLLAQKLRLSVLSVPTAYQISDARPGFMTTLGVGDVNGLAYWMARLAR